MNIIPFPQPNPIVVESELNQEIAELSTLLEHVLDDVARDHADLSTELTYTARDFYLLGRLLLLTRQQYHNRLQALLTHLGA